MYELTQEELDTLTYAQICEVVLKQQELIKTFDETLKQAIKTLNMVKEMAK